MCWCELLQEVRVAWRVLSLFPGHSCMLQKHSCLLLKWARSIAGTSSLRTLPLNSPGTSPFSLSCCVWQWDSEQGMSLWAYLVLRNCDSVSCLGTSVLQLETIKMSDEAHPSVFSTTNTQSVFFLFRFNFKWIFIFMFVHTFHNKDFWGRVSREKTSNTTLNLKSTVQNVFFFTYTLVCNGWTLHNSSVIVW